MSKEEMIKQIMRCYEESIKIGDFEGFKNKALVIALEYSLEVEDESKVTCTR